MSFALCEAPAVEVGGEYQSFLVEDVDVVEVVVAPTPTMRITLRQAGDVLGVHENTIRAWIDRGILSAVRLPSGHRRLEASEIQRFARGIRSSLAPAYDGPTVSLPPGFRPGIAAPED